jgi:hypothetical protein
MAATVEELLEGAYKMAAQRGLATNRGPDEQSFLMWVLVQEIIYCLSVNNTVRATYLLNHSPNIYR